MEGLHSASCNLRVASWFLLSRIRNKEFGPALKICKVVRFLALSASYKFPKVPITVFISASCALLKISKLDSEASPVQTLLK